MFTGTGGGEKHLKNLAHSFSPREFCVEIEFYLLTVHDTKLLLLAHLFGGGGGSGCFFVCLWLVFVVDYFVPNFLAKLTRLGILRWTVCFPFLGSCTCTPRTPGTSHTTSSSTASWSSSATWTTCAPFPASWTAWNRVNARSCSPASSATWPRKRSRWPSWPVQWLSRVPTTMVRWVEACALLGPGTHPFRAAHLAGWGAWIFCQPPWWVMLWSLLCSSCPDAWNWCRYIGCSGPPPLRYKEPYMMLCLLAVFLPTLWWIVTDEKLLGVGGLHTCDRWEAGVGGGGCSSHWRQCLLV